MDEVSFQTEHLGWETDDLLVSCRSELYEKRQLAVQVKRSFTVSKADSFDCKKTFAGFWKDFKQTAVTLRDVSHSEQPSRHGVQCTLVYAHDLLGEGRQPIRDHPLHSCLPTRC